MNRGALKRGWHFLVLATLGSVVAWLWFAPGSSERDRSSTAPEEFEIDGLAVRAKDLNFAEVWEKADFAWELPLRNRTDSSISIRDFITSCGCIIAVEPKALTIPPHQTASVRLRLDLTQRDYSQLNLSRREVGVEVTPMLKDRQVSRRTWRLKGVVQSSITVDTLHLHFGESAVHGQPPPSRKVLATAHVPFEKFEATIDPKVATVRIQKEKEQPNRFALFISPRSSLPPGHFKTQLCLRLQLNGERVDRITLPVEGDMQPEVRAVPARLVLPPRKIGETATGLVVVQVPASSSFPVQQIETESVDVEVETVQLEGIPPGRAFRINLHVTKAGEQRSQVHFTFSRSNGELVRLTMEVLGRGEPQSQPAEARHQGKMP
ncbi:MAG: DUF1573 domain-containing protein [Gemmataceae bacterium]|nr:DUF1573 domain-containing protein [Gemmataceae bacterium]